MRNLKFGHDVAVRKDSATHDRPFSKVTTLAVLTGFLSVAGPAAILTMPNKAVAQDVEICGKKVEVVKLDKTVAQMDVETAPFRLVEAMPDQSVSGGYLNGVTVPGKVSFIIATDNGKWNVVVVFPNSTRNIDLTEFVDYVNKLSVQKTERMHVVLEFGTFEFEGKNTEYVTAHLYPLNKDGKLVTRMKEWDLVYDVSYYGGETYGGASALVEPDGKRSPIAKPELLALTRN